MEHSSSSLRLVSGALAAVGVMACLAPAAFAAPTDPSGTWLTEDGRARIRVEHCAAKPDLICGYVVWMKDPNDDKGKPRHDEENKDQAKRSRELLGHQLILGLKPNHSDRYEGQIYDAENGKKYDITFWRESPTEVKVKGCMLSVLCGSQAWTEVTDVVPGQLAAPTGNPNGPKADPEFAQDASAKHPTKPAK